MDCFSTIDVYPCASFSETTTTNIIKTEKRSELRDLRGNLSKTARDGPHPPAKGASLREQSRTILLTLGRNHSGENFDIFVTAAINLMHPVSLLSPNVPENRRPLCEPLVARFPNPVWLGDHCAGPQKTGWCCELISFQSSLQHFLIPSVFFFLFFFYESYYCKPLIERGGFSPLPARMYLTFFILPCLPAAVNLEVFCEVMKWNRLLG